MKEYIIKEHPDFPYEEPKPPELIRCKDCKWYAHCDDCYGDCMKEGAVNGFVYTNDYCSRAEPKVKK